MKKLMTLMLALSFLGATVAVELRRRAQAGHREKEKGQEEKDHFLPRFSFLGRLADSLGTPRSTVLVSCAAVP